MFPDIKCTQVPSSKEFKGIIQPKKTKTNSHYLLTLMLLQTGIISVEHKIHFEVSSIHTNHDSLQI